MSRPTRILPNDNYEIPSILLEKATKYHFLKVPLLGQFNKYFTGKEKDNWCGRTSSAIINNFYCLCLDKDNAKNSYIAHGPFVDDGLGYDLRKPDSTPAFRDKTNVYRYCGLTNVFPDQKSLVGYLYPYNRTQERFDNALKIAEDEKSVVEKFKVMTEQLDRGKPLLTYTGFSGTVNGPIHLVTICGYCYLPDCAGDGKEKLWILVADPSTHGKKIETHKIFTPPSDPKKKLSRTQIKNKNLDETDLKNFKKAVRKLMKKKKNSVAEMTLFLDVRTTKEFEDLKTKLGL